MKSILMQESLKWWMSLSFGEQADIAAEKKSKNVFDLTIQEIIDLWKNEN